jgi:hypothetical protein
VRRSHALVALLLLCQVGAPAFDLKFRFVRECKYGEGRGHFAASEAKKRNPKQNKEAEGASRGGFRAVLGEGPKSEDGAHHSAPLERRGAGGESDRGAR